MEKPVIISIRGIQNPGQEEEEVMELMTQGVLRQSSEGDLSLTYLESELTGLEGTTTTFHISPGRIVLHREGTLSTEMIFQEGQKHIAFYETPYGGLMMGVSTSRAKARMGAGGGSLSIRYALEVDSRPIGEHAFEIQVTEPQLAHPGQGTGNTEKTRNEEQVLWRI